MCLKLREARRVTSVPLRDSMSLAPDRHALPRTQSQEQHQIYLDSLEVPTLDEISRIAQVQEERERQIARKYAAGQEDEVADNVEREQAAGKIQRTYKGYRMRMELQGRTLDPTTRWVEALNAARYRIITNPRKRTSISASTDLRSGSVVSTASNRTSVDARSKWHYISGIAAHALGDLPKEDEEKIQCHHGSPLPSGARYRLSTGIPLKDCKGGHEQLQKSKVNKGEPWAGKTMDLPYFLEMVDIKHRYGSNLRGYHAEWKKSESHQNFFYWLDYGDGKDVEIEGVSRQTLEKEQVRYLSREERMDYLVRIDDQGRLVWAKNGERITTSTDYRDSIHGIVPIDSDAKQFREDEIKALQNHKSSNLGTKDDVIKSSHGSVTVSPLDAPANESEAHRRYPEPASVRDAKGPKKIKQISAHAIVNHLLRQTLNKNIWIFAVDARMNMYVGIKQSGAFQHSSFVNGSRLSSAGTIQIKDGQLMALNPLSGHYRPPAKAFRHFLHHLKDQNVDMSQVSISKSYTVLIGLEAWINSKRKVKKAETKVKHGAETVIHPGRTKDRKEQEGDRSKSAAVDREKPGEDKSTLYRILDGAKEKAQERWTSLDANRRESHSGSPALEKGTELPELLMPHQQSLSELHRDPSDNGLGFAVKCEIGKADINLFDDAQETAPCSGTTTISGAN